MYGRNVVLGQLKTHPMKRILLSIFSLSIATAALAQTATTKQFPPLGAAYSVKGVSTPITPLTTGPDQVWVYNNLTVSQLIEYKVVDIQTLPSTVKDPVPNAFIGYQATGAPSPELAQYDFFDNSATHLIKVGTKSSGSQPTQAKNDTLFKWGHTFGETVFYNGFNRKYAAYGTLTLNGKTYTDVVMIKSFNSALTQDTITQLHHFSPYYQLLMSYTSGPGGMKNVLAFDVTSTGNVGIEESTIGTTLAVFPNPAKELINIQTPPNFTGKIEIFTLTGKLAKSVAASGNQAFQQVNISDLTSGVYLVKIADKTSKIIVE